MAFISLFFRILIKFTEVSDNANISDPIAVPSSLNSSSHYMLNIATIAEQKLAANPTRSKDDQRTNTLD